MIDNCLVNLSVLLDVMSGFDKVYIKGDDSLARGRDVQFDVKRMKFYTNECNWKFKPESGNSAEFVSFLVNKHGCAFNLPRLTGKVISRCYTNKEDFDNYREAIGVTLRYNKIDEGINTNRVKSFH